MCYSNLFKWWCHLHCRQKNLNIENLMQTFENLLLQNYLTKFLDIAHTNSPWVCVMKSGSIGGVTYIIGDIIAKDNLNIAN